jgi:DNA-binding transcriptional regulator YhcF (GntR family)
MIARQLESDIRNGDLLPGTKLPPQRELADHLDVNVNTDSRAFGICSRKGLLGGTVGSGAFVAYDALAKNNVAPQDESCKEVLIYACDNARIKALYIMPGYQKLKCVQ